MNSPLVEISIVENFALQNSKCLKFSRISVASKVFVLFLCLVPFNKDICNYSQKCFPSKFFLICVNSSSFIKPKSMNSFTNTLVASFKKLTKFGSSIFAKTVVAYFSFFPKQPNPLILNFLRFSARILIISSEFLIQSIAFFCLSGVFNLSIRRVI